MANRLRIIALLILKGVVFHHGGVPENCPLALMGRFRSLVDRFPTLMGRFPECLNGPCPLLKMSWKTARKRSIQQHLGTTLSVRRLTPRSQSKKSYGENLGL